MVRLFNFAPKQFLFCLPGLSGFLKAVELPNHSFYVVSVAQENLIVCHHFLAKKAAKFGKRQKTPTSLKTEFSVTAFL